MKTKYVKVPFEVDLAKRIQNKECEGRIVTCDGRDVRIVCWDRKCFDYPIVALIDNIDNGEGLEFFTKDGETRYCNDAVKLMLEIPEYMTFKDGDVIAYDNVKDVFFIIGSKCSMTDENPHYYVKYEKGYLTFGTEDSFCRLKGSRLATEEEKQKIIEALKTSKNPKAKECLKILGIEQKQEYEFNPFDKVLVRCSDESQWCARFFDRMFKGNYACTDSLRYKQCIPYNEQTAHLLGTTEKYE